jgi:hypothetical protein
MQLTSTEKKGSKVVMHETQPSKYFKPILDLTGTRWLRKTTANKYRTRDKRSYSGLSNMALYTK